jgi:hypothetical protein
MDYIYSHVPSTVKLGLEEKKFLLQQHANNHPFSAHALRGAVCLAWHVQQLSASINVELVGSQEVFNSLWMG